MKSNSQPISLGVTSRGLYSVTRMLKFVFCSLCFVLAVLPSLAQNQFQTVLFMGRNDLEIGNTIAVRRDGASIVGGSTAPLSGSKSGYIIWEDVVGNGGAELVKSYSLGTGDFSLSAIDTCPGSTSLAVVGNRTGGTLPDALFMQVSVNGTVVGTRYFNSGNGETLNDVKSLSDGTFVVVGSISSSGDGTRRAFVARIGTAAQNFPLLWARVLGGASGFPFNADAAIALEQFPDGRLLVCGITNQGTGNSQGVTFLWQLNVAGTQLALQRITFDPSLLRPVPTDMAITPDQHIIISGTALTAAGSGKFKSWYLRLNSDLSGPIFRTVSLIGEPTRNLELRAIDVHPSMNVTWAAGTVEVLDTSGVYENEGFLFAFDDLCNPSFAIAPQFAGDDAFNDLNIVSDQVYPTFRAIGSSNRGFFPTFNLARTNVLEYRGSRDGYSCMSNKYIGVVTRPLPATVSTLSLALSSSMATNTVFVVVGTPLLSGLRNCSPSRYANPDLHPKGGAVGATEPTEADEPTGDE